MAKFQSKIGWKRLRMRENKNYHSVSFLLDALQKISEKRKKIQKNKNYHYGFISNQNRLEMGDK